MSEVRVCLVNLDPVGILGREAGDVTIELTSVPTRAVTGADLVVSTLPSLRSGGRRSFPSPLVTNARRMALQLRPVGPIRASS